MLHYDQSAKVYDKQYYEEQAAKINAALAGFTLEKESTILDAGCGTGVLFSYVANKSILVVGIDISALIVKLAKKRVNTYANVALIRADADYMPFPDATVDTVFALTLLQNTPRQLLTLEEMKRVTKQNSIIVVTGLKKAFSRREFTSLLREAGLEIKAFNFDEKLRDYVAICVKPQRNP
jgi:ubiquinone/menaquinone biosynthesis C-methylase UbiE